MITAKNGQLETFCTSFQFYISWPTSCIKRVIKCLTPDSVFLALARCNNCAVSSCVCFSSVDATEDNSRMGRLCNHASGKLVTAIVKVVIMDNIPHLCLFAVRDLDIDDQVPYNYNIKLPFVDKVRSFPPICSCSVRNDVHIVLFLYRSFKICCCNAMNTESATQTCCHTKKQHDSWFMIF